MIQPNDPRCIRNSEQMKKQEIYDRGLGYLQNLNKEEIKEIYTDSPLDSDVDKLEKEGKIKFINGRVQIIRKEQ